MMTTTNPVRVPAGVSTGGQFTAAARAESSVDLSASGMESLIRRGVLSPGARGMDPREAIDQHAEATGATFAERVDMLGEVGLRPRLRVDDLLDGEKLARADLEAVDLAEVEVDLVDGVDEFTVWRRPQKVRGRWRVDLGDEFGTAAGVIYANDEALVAVAEYDEEERCSQCGANLADGEGFDGRCGNCADRAEADGEWDDEEDD